MPKIDNDESENDGIDENTSRFMHEIANKAQSSHAARLKKQLDAEFSKRLDMFSEQLMEKLAPVLGAVGANNTSAAKVDNSDNTSDGDIEAEKLKRYYERKYKDMQAKLDAEISLREQERAEKLKYEERTALTTALQEQGVTGPQLKGAIALLYNSEGRVKRGSDGSLLFATTRDGYEEEMPLAEGVKEWVSSGEGKYYLPPRPASGTGAPQMRPLTQLDPKTATLDEKNAAMAQLFGGFLGIE